ncbi:MAG: magnesium transporter [Verrucomicrobia bacterium]|nr:magnesium transporter [Verrucomicrobiota bacterium]
MSANTDKENKQQLEDLVELIPELLQSHQWRLVNEAVRGFAEPELADLLLQLDKTERVLFFRCLPRRRAAEVFSYLDYEHQDNLLDDLTDDDTRRLLTDLSPDDRTALLEELPAKMTQRMMQLLSPEKLKEARQLLGYPEESVGRLMTPYYISIRPTMTFAEALEHIRKTGKDSETFNVIYVTDDNGKLVDIIRLRRIILGDPNTTVGAALNYKFAALSAFDDREQAVKMIRRYDLNALPVVDSEGTMLGIVTVDDVLDVAEEEATEDFHKSAAVAPLEMPYSLAQPSFLYRKRIGWLTVLIFVNLISANVIGAYEDQLMEFIVLTFFMPLLIASGGNAGAQSATLMVRALATGDLQVNRWLPAIAKETFVGILLGLSMGALAFLLGLYRGDTAIGWVVGLSMVSIVVVANLIGVILPFTLTKLKMDPAVASSPLITSLMDAIGLLIYFGIAAQILFK